MHNEPDKKVLYINDLLQYLLQSNITLLVNDQSSETNTDIILCGMWRIIKNIKTKKFSYRRLNVTYSNGQFDATWVKTTKIFSLPLFNFYFKSDFFFDRIFSWCFKAILSDLKDTLILQHSVKETRQYNLKKRADRGAIAHNIDKRLFFHIPVNSKNKAVLQLIKKAWPLLNDRSLVNVYIKIFHIPQSEDGDFPLSSIGLNEINKFEKHALSSKYALEHKSLLPLLQFIEPSHYADKALFSNKVLLSLLMQKGINLTKGDLRILKIQPITFSKFFCYELTALTGSVEKINLVRKFIRSPLLMSCPLKVRCALFERYMMTIDHAPLSLTIFEKWVIYHHQMFKVLKPTKHSDQWERLIFKCIHVIDWYSRTIPQLHKNQTWTSFSTLADAWTQRQRETDELEYLKLGDIRWEKSLPDDVHVVIENEEIIINEIDNAMDLNKEGAELEHCVFSYRYDCLEKRYHVFSIKHVISGETKERATLGVHVNEQTHLFQFDQLRTFNNGVASKNFNLLSKALITSLNEKISGSSDLAA